MIRIGLCSWTEKTLIESGEFYPQDIKTAEQRLRYYSSHFNTVEVDSTYYSLPSERNSFLWSQRTPKDFIFHIKVYGALTGHGIDPKTLPQDIQRELPSSDRTSRYIYIKDPYIRRLIVERFKQALIPLYKSHKLGLMVFQYPPWFRYSTENLDFIIHCKEVMSPYPIAVEFRHGSWLTEDRRQSVIHQLMKHQITYITADEPQYGNLDTIPYYPAVTTDIAYFRLHGRNRENWLKKGIDTTYRYAYLYSQEELKEFIPAIQRSDTLAKVVFVMLNNCHRGFAAKNAMQMKGLIGDSLY